MGKFVVDTITEFEEHRKMSLPIKKCQTCLLDFQPKRKSRRHCYNCDVRVREKIARAAHKKEQPCVKCGVLFLPLMAKSRFCSKGCNVSYHSDRTTKDLITSRHCQMCGSNFMLVNRIGDCCSLRCSRHQAKAAHPGSCYCVVCGVYFMRTTATRKCCSTSCSDRILRKARIRNLQCIDCSDNFSHNTKGAVPKRCPACRVRRPRVLSASPCDFCGKHFRHANTDSPRFCSRLCSSSGIHAEGLCDDYDAAEVLRAIVSFVKECRHTPILEEICMSAGVSAQYVFNKFGLRVGGIFKLAGRLNKSSFPSKFEERVYYSLLDIGITNEDIKRQKTFPGLTSMSGRRPLRYDFYIISRNILVEADGEQHTGKSHPLFDCGSTQASDLKKNAYALKHGIELVRIPYLTTFKGVFESVSQLLAPLVSDDQSKAL